MFIKILWRPGGVAAAMVKQKGNGDGEKRWVRFGSEEVIPCKNIIMCFSLISIVNNIQLLLILFWKLFDC